MEEVRFLEDLIQREQVKAIVLKTFRVKYGDLRLFRLTSSSVLVLGFHVFSLSMPLRVAQSSAAEVEGVRVCRAST